MDANLILTKNYEKYHFYFEKGRMYVEKLSMHYTEKSIAPGIFILKLTTCSIKKIYKSQKIKKFKKKQLKTTQKT